VRFAETADLPIPGNSPLGIARGRAPVRAGPVCCCSGDGLNREPDYSLVSILHETRGDKVHKRQVADLAVHHRNFCS
jgi:hypothetical protein